MWLPNIAFLGEGAGRRPGTDWDANSTECEPVPMPVKLEALLRDGAAQALDPGPPRLPPGAIIFDCTVVNVSTAAEICLNVTTVGWAAEPAIGVIHTGRVPYELGYRDRRIASHGHTITVSS